MNYGQRIGEQWMQKVCSKEFTTELANEKHVSVFLTSHLVANSAKIL